MSLIIAALIPVLFFLFYIFKKDKNKEPISLLLKCFFGGILSILIALIIDIPFVFIGELFTSPFTKSFYEAFFVAGFPEELAKFIILYWIVWKNKFFDEHYDGIVLAVFVSMGFALLENILYVFNGGMQTAIVRAVFSIPGHGLFAVSMGYYFSLAKHENDGKQKKYLILSLLIPVILHGTFDFLLMYLSHQNESETGLIGLLFILFFIFIIFLWKHGIKKINTLIVSDQKRNI